MQSNNTAIKNNQKRIPYFLIYSRLVMAVYLILTAFSKPLQDPILISIVLVTGILTDIFDGIIARKLKSDTVHLRQLDSKVDTAFWISFLYLLLCIHPKFMRDHAVQLFILLASEIVIQLLGYFKFNRALALHTYSAKTWAVLLTFTVLRLLLVGNAETLFYMMFIWGLISQTEVLIIVFKLKVFTVDVRSVFSLFKNAEANSRLINRK